MIALNWRSSSPSRRRTPWSAAAPGAVLTAAGLTESVPLHPGAITAARTTEIMIRPAGTGGGVDASISVPSVPCDDVRGPSDDIAAPNVILATGTSLRIGAR
jgi:hypothetical protein